MSGLMGAGSVILIVDMASSHMPRQAHIYLPNEDRPAILVPVYHTGCWIVEQSNPTLLSEWRDPVELARAAHIERSDLGLA